MLVNSTFFSNNQEGIKQYVLQSPTCRTTKSKTNQLGSYGSKQEEDQPSRTSKIPANSNKVRQLSEKAQQNYKEKSVVSEKVDTKKQWKRKNVGKRDASRRARPRSKN